MTNTNTNPAGDLWALWGEDTFPDRCVSAAVALLTAAYPVPLDDAHPESDEALEGIKGVWEGVAAVSREFTAGEAVQGLLRVAHAAVCLLADELGRDPGDLLREAALAAEA